MKGEKPAICYKGRCRHFKRYSELHNRLPFAFRQTLSAAFGTENHASVIIKSTV